VHQLCAPLNITGLGVLGWRQTQWSIARASFGIFNRTFSLPKAVQAGQIAAELRDGVLHLMVPLSPEIRPQKIKISS